MSQDNRQGPDRDFEQAVSLRLAKLRSGPVDTSGLDHALRSKIPSADSGRGIFRFRPLRAVAASVLLAVSVIVAVLIFSSGRPALAEGSQMAQVHQDIISGRLPVMQVTSIEAANRMLDSQSPGAPTLPNVPDGHVMACCMKSVHNKKMACVLLRDGGTPVTLAVASAADMQMPSTPVTRVNGIDYRVQKVGTLNMVMTQRNGKWLCLIGETTASRLIEVAAQVQF